MSTSPSDPVRLSTSRNGPNSSSSADSTIAPRVLNLAEAAAFVRYFRAHLSNTVNGKVRGVPRVPAVRIRLDDPVRGTTHMRQRGCNSKEKQK